MTNTYEKNHERLLRLANEHGLILNPDVGRVARVAGMMAENYDMMGEWVCPCKQEHTPPEPGKDKTCPCLEWLNEIASDGHCHCRLFFSS